MTWRREDQRSFESDKIAALIVPYTRGKGLDLGCGMRKAWPHFIGVDNCQTFAKNAADVRSDLKDLGIFADGSLDFVFSSHAIEDFPQDEVPALLKEWARPLKVGGYLILYVPSANLYPKVGDEGANPAHKWDIYPGDIERHLKAATLCGWTQIEREERNGTNEYSLFLVFEKRRDGQWLERIWKRNPEGKKRCLVIRYGAIGDQIVASSILPGLRDQGYFITYNTTPAAQEILQHDPYVDEWLIQDTDQVPNMQLGAYWASLVERYDHIVNLCESIEMGLLPIPGRLSHGYPLAARQKLFNRNYLEVTHDIAAVPHLFRPKFYPTDSELYRARKFRANFGPSVLWAINGSSPHKVWPWVHIVASWLLQRTPCDIVIAADPGIGKQLQDAILETLKADGADLSRVHPMAGEWKIREALTFAQVADCVVGPETGILNAVCMERVPKVIYLSHSSPENLTKHWTNTTVLTQAKGKTSCPEFPCHRMHYSWEFCRQDPETNAAACASNISPERIFEAIALALGARKAA